MEDPFFAQSARFDLAQVVEDGERVAMAARVRSSVMPEGAGRGADLLPAGGPVFVGDCLGRVRPSQTPPPDRPSKPCR